MIWENYVKDTVSGVVEPKPKNNNVLPVLVDEEKKSQNELDGVEAWYASVKKHIKFFGGLSGGFAAIILVFIVVFGANSGLLFLLSLAGGMMLLIGIIFWVCYSVVSEAREKHSNNMNNLSTIKNRLR